MSASVWENPYNGLDTTDAFDVSATCYIASGTSSLWTYQVSNSSLSRGGAHPEAAWSNWTLYVAPSGNSSFASCLELPISYRYARIIRTVSGASFVIDWSKQIRERGSL
jgi:hypothetical protein